MGCNFTSLCYNAAIDTNGNEVVKYVYDAWGNHVVYNSAGAQNSDATFIGNVNPFRYRGYYYDIETGLYYLQTRYYDPETGRFVTIDGIDYIDPDSINGLNLYAYCSNNPVMNVDPSGHSAILIGLVIGAIIGACVGFGSAVYVDYQDDGQIFNGSVKWYNYLGASLLGGIIGAGIGAGLGAFAGLSFSATLPTYGLINSGGALVVGITGTTTLTVTGTQILGAAGVLGSIYLFAKGGKPNNKYQNQQWAEAMRQLGIEKGDLWRRLHDEIHKYPYQEKLKDLLNILRSILRKWGKL